MEFYIFDVKDTAFDTKYTLKNRIKLNRVEKNLTQQQLGDLINVTRQTIAVIEQGRQEPTLTIAMKMACLFGKKIQDIFYYEKKG